MREQIFEAETVDAALEQASRQWNVELDALNYEVLETEADDFWGFEGTSVKVRVRVPEPEDEGAAAAEGPAAAVEDAGERGAAPAAEVEPPAAEPGPEAPERQPSTAEAAPEAPERQPSMAEAGLEAPEPQPPSAEPEPEVPQPPPAEGGPEAPEPQPPSAELEPEVPEPGPPAAEARPEARPEPEARRPEPEEAAAEPSPPRGAPTAEGGGDIEVLIEGLLERVFAAIDFDCTVAVTEGEDTIHVHVGGEDKKYLVDRKGRALSSLQLILNHAFRHRDVGDDKKIRVDAGDFRERREEELQDLAFQVAHRAKETGEDQETQPLNPYERRIVHLALADDPAVATRSQGNGFLKSILVTVQK